MMNVNMQDLKYQAVGLPDEVRMYHYAGDFAGELSCIDRWLARQVPDCLRKRLELRGREAGILHPGEPAHLGERGSMIRVLIVDDQELFGESLKVSARTLRWPARLLACRRR